MEIILWYTGSKLVAMKQNFPRWRQSNVIPDRYIVEANFILDQSKFIYCRSKFCIVLETNVYKEAIYCVTLWKQIILDKQNLIIAEANLYCRWKQSTPKNRE